MPPAENYVKTVPGMPSARSAVNTENVPNTVPVKRVLIAGLILGIFHPPVIGFVYALCFAFTKATRRAALYVAIWTIAWTVLYGFALGFLGAWISNPYVSSLTKEIGTTRTTEITSPTDIVLPKAPTL